MSEPVPLTQFSKGSGCGCKIAPAVLRQILDGVRTTQHFPSLLVGNESSDDAAVIELPGGLCLISTVDFFTPVVDDARTFGKIAAANALSDVYAMGGTPVAAIAVLGWPVDKLPPALAGEVLLGAREVCDSIGIPLAGGHSIEAPEPFFGLSVNGVVQKAHIRCNTGVKEGDLLFLTKPIGSGMISAARKRGIATPEMSEDAERWMCTLNTAGAVFGTLHGVHAMTDITGFGLLGHLREMLGDGNCSAELFTRKIPVMKGVEQLIAQMVYPDMTMKTYSALAPFTSSLDAYALLLGCDPQTSGGLLVAVNPNFADEFRASARGLNLPDFVFEPIGCIIARSSHLISLV